MTGIATIEEAPDKRTERQFRKIRAALRAGHVAIGGISEQTGLDRQTVFNRLSALVEAGEVSKTNGSAYNEYRLIEKQSEPEPAAVEKPLRDRLIETLEEFPFQSLRHLCGHTNAAGLEIIEVVDADPEFGYRFTAGTTIYYLAKNDPGERQLYNTGECYFALKEEEKKMENAVKKAKSKVSAELVEQCAFEGLDLKRAAERCGLGEATLRNYLFMPSQRRSELAEAWERGIERKKQSGLEQLVETPPAAVEEKPGSLQEYLAQNGKTDYDGDGKTDYDAIPITEAEDEAFEAINKNGNHSEDFYDHNGQSEEIPSDWKIIPKAKVKGDVQTDPRFADTIEHISKNGRSKNSIERVKTQLAESVPAIEMHFSPTFDRPVPDIDQTKLVPMGGGVLEFALSDVNIFKATKKERALLMRIVDLVQKYEAEK